MVVASAAVACDSTREAHPTTLANTAWRAVSVNGQPTVAGSEPTARFKIADATGYGGCNDWYSPYRYDPSNGRISFDQLAMTARGCTNPAAGPVEEAFAKALVAVTSASVDPAGRLVLSGAGGEIVLAVDAIGVKSSPGSGDGNR